MLRALHQEIVLSAECKAKDIDWDKITEKMDGKDGWAERLTRLRGDIVPASATFTSLDAAAR
jgi:hypothetical protein